MQGADRALAVHNALRAHLPELAALGANAPFYEGRASGLESVRPKLSELLPRQGAPPVIGSLDELAATYRWGVASGMLASPAQWWWELRLHPVHATVEVRVPDTQATTAETAAIGAVAHALVARLAEPTAARLGCPSELRDARKLVDANGAQRQRAAAGAGGALAAAAWLADRFLGWRLAMLSLPSPRGAGHLLGAWGDARSSLREPLTAPAAA